MPEYTANYSLIKPLDNETADIAVVNQNMDTIDGQMKQSAGAVAAHLAESMIHTAGGTVNALVVATGGDFQYAQGACLKFKALADNTGNMTVDIDGKGIKSLKKPDGSQVTAGGVKSGRVYEIYYDAGGDCFFLLARAEGNAVAGDVLAGKTFSNGDDTGIAGTMPNQGQKIITPGTSNIVISAGYHDGTGYVAGDADLIPANIKAGKNIFDVAGNSNVVDTSPGTAAAGDILTGKIAFADGTQLTGSMPNRGAYNITPGMSNVAIPAGYHNGSGVVYGDADIVASNIVLGKNIFGVAGTAVVDPCFTLYTHGYDVRCLFDKVNVITGNENTVYNNSAEHYKYVYTYASGRIGETSAVTSNAIDLTNFSRLVIVWGGSTTGTSGTSIECYAALCVSVSKTDNYLTNNATIFKDRASFDIVTETIDVAALIGLYYIRVHSYVSADYNSNARGASHIYLYYLALE